MITRAMRIRRRLRSSRASAMTSEERRLELQEAERLMAQEGGRRPAVDDVTPEDAPGPRAHTR